MDTVLTILAVDNQRAVTTSLRYVFAGPRYEVTTAESGQAALAEISARTDLFDVIIVDYKMPGLTGLELVDAIKRRGAGGKIIVISAHLSSEVRESFERLAVHAVFPKPFDVAQLRSAVDRIAA